MCDDLHDFDKILFFLSTKLNRIFCEREFVGCVKEDFQTVLESKSDRCVLVFPKLDPIFLRALRYLAAAFNLAVFYIGLGLNRTVAVCKKSELNEHADEADSVENHWQMDQRKHEAASAIKCAKKKTRPSLQLYVPPAQRISSKINPGHIEHPIPPDKSCSHKTAKRDKHKPALRVDKELGECHKFTVEQNIEDSIPPLIPEQVAESAGANVTFNCMRYELSDLHNEPINYPTVSESDLHMLGLKIMDPMDNNQSEVKSLLSVDETNCDINASMEKPTEFEKCATIQKCTPQLKESEIINVTDLNLPEEDKTQLHTEPLKLIDNLTNTESTNNQPVIIQSRLKKEDLDGEKEEMKRAIENINRKSRPLIKHIHNDDTLHINNNPKNIRRLAKKIDEAIQDEENLTNWEDMFSDDGELQTDYMEEIVKRVGTNTTIVKANQDYSAYQSKKLGDLEHVIELYEFPSTLKTQDLMQLYSSVHQEPMYIKWCDDTHALLVLSTPSQAQRALQIEHDIIKARPMSAASSVSTLIAYKNDLKPAMKRPQTSMQTARRLITTYLGTHTRVSKEELEQEKNALRQAREQRRQERQNEKDAWEGHPKSSTSE